ncbi:MAG: hypothetical protein ACLR76_04965 [Alistipes sp.]
MTYFNGVQVGATHALEQERVYRVPGKLVEGARRSSQSVCSTPEATAGSITTARRFA